MKLQSDLTGNKKKLLESCYYAIKNAEDKLIVKSIKRNLDLEETCDVPLPIDTIQISCCSIGDTLYVNKKLCTDFDKF